VSIFPERDNETILEIAKNVSDSMDKMTKNMSDRELCRLIDVSGTLAEQMGRLRQAAVHEAWWRNKYRNIDPAFCGICGDRHTGACVIKT